MACCEPKKDMRTVSEKKDIDEESPILPRIDEVVETLTECQIYSRRITRGPASLELLYSATFDLGCPDCTVYVERYLQACLEIFIFTAASSWLITWAFNPGIIGRNLLNDIVGYNNICVGFDTSPARYFAVPFMVLTTYVGIRYCMLDSIRANQLHKQGRLKKSRLVFSRFANFVFAVCLLFWPMLLVVTPDVNATVHTNMFLFIMIIPITLATVANFAEAEHLMTGSVIWLSVFCVCGVGLTAGGVIDFNGYDWPRCYKAADPSWSGDMRKKPSVEAILSLGDNPACKQEPAVPWQLLATFDYGWFLCLFLSSIFLPVASALKVDIELSVNQFRYKGRLQEGH